MRAFFCLVFSLLILGATPALAEEPIVIAVGGYEFAPYVDLGPDGQPTGLTLDLIQALNQAQTDFSFQFVMTSPARRFDDFRHGRYDVILFENPAWGWVAQKIPVAVSKEFFKDGEVYITRAIDGRDQSYFNNLFGKSTAGILGYHYGFAGFNADPEFLINQWSMTLVNTNSASIEMVRKGRVDFAVVTKSYLNRYLKINPDARPELLVSDRYDQHYSHRALVRSGAKITMDQMQAILDVLEAEGEFDALWERAGVVE